LPGLRTKRGEERRRLRRKGRAIILAMQKRTGEKEVVRGGQLSAASSRGTRLELEAKLVGYADS